MGEKNKKTKANDCKSGAVNDDEWARSSSSIPGINERSERAPWAVLQLILEMDLSNSTRQYSSHDFVGYFLPPLWFVLSFLSGLTVKSKPYTVDTEG